MVIPAGTTSQGADEGAACTTVPSIDNGPQPEISGARVAASCRTLAAAAGLAVALLGCLVLGGWVFDVPVLKSLRPDWATMKANTATGLLFAGVAVWLL